MSIYVIINGRRVEVSEGQTVLDAINANGYYVPQLCKDPDMKPIGACRTCLVQIEGIRGYPTACSTPLSDEMNIVTYGEDVDRIRAGVLDLTLGMVNDYKSVGQLSEAASKFGLSESSWNARVREVADTSNPVFDIAMSSCILCARCVNACQDSHQFIGAIDYLGTGEKSRIGTFLDRPLIDSICTTCGQCLSVCPTGAIHIKEKVK